MKKSKHRSKLREAREAVAHESVKILERERAEHAARIRSEQEIRAGHAKQQESRELAYIDADLIPAHVIRENLVDYRAVRSATDFGGPVETAVTLTFQGPMPATVARALSALNPDERPSS